MSDVYHVILAQCSCACVLASIVAFGNEESFTLRQDRQHYGCWRWNPHTGRW